MTKPRSKKPLASTSAAAAAITSDNSGSESEEETQLEFDEGERKKSLNAVVSSIKNVLYSTLYSYTLKGSQYLWMILLKNCKMFRVTL